MTLIAFEREKRIKEAKKMAIKEFNEWEIQNKKRKVASPKRKSVEMIIPEKELFSFIKNHQDI